MAMQEGLKVMSKVYKHIEPNRGPISSAINSQIVRGAILLSLPLTISFVKGSWDAMKRIWFNHN